MPEVIEGQDQVNEKIQSRINDDESITVTGEMRQGNAMTSMEEGQTSKAPKTRKQAPTTTKVTDAKSLVEKLKEKIICVEYISSIEIPEINTLASKELRELIITFQKNIETSKNDAISVIQKL